MFYFSINIFIKNLSNNYQDAICYSWTIISSPFIIETCLTIGILFYMLFAAFSYRFTKKLETILFLQNLVLKYLILILVLNWILFFNYINIVTINKFFADSQINNLFIFVMKHILLNCGTISYYFCCKYNNDNLVIRKEFPILFLSSLCLFLFLISSINIIHIVYLLIGISICFYALIYSYTSIFGKIAHEAANKYFVLSAIGVLLISKGVYFITNLFGTENLQQINDQLIAYLILNLDTMEYTVLKISLLLIFFGFIFKLSAAPMHFWAPEIYNSVPFAFISYFSIASKFTISIVFLRLFKNFFFVLFLDENINILFRQELETCLIIIIILSITIGGFNAIFEQQTKRFIAYSSTNQIGFLLIPILGYTTSIFSIKAFIFFLYTYTLNLLILFYLLNYFLSLKLIKIPAIPNFINKLYITTTQFHKNFYVTNETNIAFRIKNYAFFTQFEMSLNTTLNYITNFRALFQLKTLTPQYYAATAFELEEPNKLCIELAENTFEKVTIHVLLICLIFSFSGIPPFVGFFAKFYVLLYAFKIENYLIFWIGLFASIINAYYYLRILFIYFFIKNEKINNQFLLKISKLFFESKQPDLAQPLLYYWFLIKLEQLNRNKVAILNVLIICFFLLFPIIVNFENYFFIKIINNNFIYNFIPFFFLSKNKNLKKNSFFYLAFNLNLLFSNETLLSLFYFLIIGIVLNFIMLVIPFFFNKKKINIESTSEYECGFEPYDNAIKHPFSIHYYLIGIMFLIFDVEISLLIPWGSFLFTLQSFEIFWTGVFFIILLCLGFFYELKHNLLKWHVFFIINLETINIIIFEIINIQNLFFIVFFIIKIICILLTVAFYTIAERKIMASIQRRLGPNIEGGQFGLLQPLADGLKLFIKNFTISRSINLPIFLIAPSLTFILSLITWNFIPFFENYDFEASQTLWNITNLPLKSFTSFTNFGILFILAISSLNTYGIILGGWASNSKYAFLGALRSSAQMISYEISISLTILPIIILTQTYNLTEIINIQEKTTWFILPLLPNFIIFLISMLAETNRTPFDLPEAEAELVAGYNVEYSSIAFALYFLGEYSNMLLMSSLITILFLGGWLLPLGFIITIKIVMILTIISKILIFSVFFIIIRATMPRYNYAQLMQIGWESFLPLTLGFLIFFSAMSIIIFTIK